MITYDDELLRQAIRQFGTVTQALVAVEEMSELQKEILKSVNRGQNNRTHILEELVDVLIMLRQLVFIYGNTYSEIQEIVDKKQERLKGYLNEKMH